MESAPKDLAGLAARLGDNLKRLRDARGLTQAQIARLAGIPRATWAHLESGDGNPTLQVLHRASAALQVTIEELVAPPREAGRFYPRGTLPIRERAGATVRRLLPDPIPGVAIDRMELAPRGRMTGVPHTQGAHEYLTCESGALELTVAGKSFRLGPGDVVAFRGDQRHAYGNPGDRTAVGYSVVLLAPVA